MQSPSTQERESFFAAQARHRSAARRWSLLAGCVVILLALAIGLLLAPLAWAVIGLLLDLVNLVLPTPNLLHHAFQWIDALTNEKTVTTSGDIVRLLAIAALPGAGLLGFAWWTLTRISADHHFELVRDRLGLRDPRRDDLEEIQLGNLVEEIAIAAGHTSPRLLLVDTPNCNIAVYGDGPDATLIVTRGVLDRLNRDQTQALVGQAIAALGNGDGALAGRMLRLIEMTGLLMLLSQAPLSAGARAALAPLLPWKRNGNSLDMLRHALGEPLQFDMNPDKDPSGKQTLTWRDWLRMPLMGSLIIGIIIVPVATMFLLAPLTSLIWRRRRLLADAVAVQFMRNPQALAEAYAALAEMPTRLDIGVPWLVNLFVLDAIVKAPMQMTSPYPSLARRIERLNAMGASIAPPATTPVNAMFWLLISPLLALLVVLVGALIYLGCFVSIALNMLFLGIPVGALHVLLRHIAGG
jgi:Zn-dependent protease with chaperone function